MSDSEQITVYQLKILGLLQDTDTVGEFKNRSIQAIVRSGRSPNRMGLKLLRTLPKKLTHRFRVQVLADTGFSSVEFLTGVKKLRHQAIVGIPNNRKLADGRQIKMLGKKGQQVKLSGLDGVVTASWFYLKRDGKLEKRFVISTRTLKGSTIAWWGSRRWAIEGFFKTAKYRFGLASFGQQTLLGVYRWLILSFISFVLTHWIYLSSNVSLPPEWRQVCELALQQLMPQILVSSLLVAIERQREFLRSQGLALVLVSIKI
jgi:Transposase DDE domain